MPISDARREANRRNALLSCGPKTAEGKARSRRNEDGLESAKPDLQSSFKKPGGEPASPRLLGNASRREGREQAQTQSVRSSKRPG